MRKIQFICFFIFCGLNGFSQTYKDKHFVLNENLTGSNKTYIVRDYIKLTGGFRYTAQANKRFVGKIDPSLVFETNYTDNQTPWSSDLPVGSLPGSVNVSPTGAATYQIPIALPPGTAGIMPNLSIVYNSQSGDGMLGKGWTISGFSAITRIPATIYHDGFVDGVDFDDNDRFALDGQRLIAVSGNYGAHNTEYRTENESFSKIKSYYTSGNGPLKFFVETKSGIKMQYAYTENSRIQAPGKYDVMYWLLNKVYDTKGNYYTITYKEEDGEFYPLEINYTGHNSDMQPYNKIKFFYTEKTDKSISYVAGSKFKSTVLLSDIKIYNNDRLIRKYSFTYNYNMFSRLSEIKLYEDRNKTINTTKIEWGGETIAVDDRNINLKGTGDYYPGDYNGDGKTDIMILVKLKDSNGVLQFDEYGRQKYEKQEIYTSNGNGYFILYYSNDIGPDDGYYTEQYPGDFNGDGITDVFSVTYNPNTHKFVHCFMLSDKTNNLFTYMFPSIPENSYSQGKQIRVGDFDGNGKDDVFIYNTEITSIYPIFEMKYIYNIYTLNSNNNNTNTIYSNNNGLPLLKSYVLDFNGNGISDLMFIYSGYNNCCKIVEKRHNNTESFNSLYESGYPTQDHRIYTGDFNGDGKTDIMTWTSYQNIGWELHLSKGNSLSASVNIPDFDKNVDPQASNDNDNYIIADFNGDGKADILEQYILWDDGTSTESRFNIFYTSFNNDFVYKKGYKDIEAVWPYIQQYKPNVDINGDGKQDVILNTGYYDNYRKVLFFHPNEKKHLVKSVTDGYNNKTRFDFKPITDASVYTKGSGATFPVMDFQGALYVVKSLVAPNGIGSGTTTQNYRYEAAKIHKQGKGFLGFMKVKSENLTTHIISESQFTYNPTYFNTYPVSSKTYYSNTAHLISSNTITNQHIHYFGNKRIFSYPKQSESTDYLTNTTVNTITDIDDNTGNILRTYATTADGNTETLYQNYITAGAWLPTKPTKTIVNKTANGKPSYTRTSNFEYYTNGLLKKSIADPNEDKPITTEYQYNSFGNVTHTKVTTPGMPAKNSYLSYDAKNRFVTSQTDPLGFTSYKTYDEETGNVLTETDINGHTTKFQYDAFGNLKETELPDGTKAYQTTHWYTGSGISNAKTYTLTSADGEAPVKTYFDKLGRKIRTETAGFNDETIVSETNYNSKGQVYRSYESHFAGETGNYSTFYYDSYGRQTRIVSPIGTTLYTYNVAGNPKKTKITYPDNSFKISTMNSLGQVTEAEDRGGTINYDYNSAGLPLTITTVGGGTLTMTYDIYGNKLSLTDPDAGTITYTYDAFSNIISQTDAKGNTHTMSYDIAGRLIQKTGPDGTTRYTYDTAPNAKTMLASETYNGNIKTYSYDNLSRLQSVTETFEGENYTYTYTYDNLGRISKMTYPNGFAYTKQYKSNGYLKQINTESGALIWKPEARNAQGQITELLKGNGLTTYKTYNTVSHMPEAVVTGTIQHFEYEFENTTGNLLSREDRIHGNTESFTYDNLNRLTQINTNGNIFNINYDNTGNITDKTDAGAYSYDKEKIHAVTQVTGDVYLPSFNQNITYTAFNKVNKISEANNELDFTYGLNNQRKKTVLKENGQISQTKYYFGSYEKTIKADTITEYCWLPGGALYKTTNGKGELLFTYTDHLGSISQITDNTGNLLAEQSFDAWGRYRDPETWQILSPDAARLLSFVEVNGRGYTAHEMLPTFALINMNGRLYDPQLGRMLSPDNYIQLPDYTQNFNRYSYVLNNPLKYRDPNGEFINLIIGAIVGAYMGYIAGDMAGATGWKLVGYIGVGALAGALTSGMAAGVGSALGGGSFAAGFVGSAAAEIAPTGFIAGATIGATSGFVGGFVTGVGTGLLEGQTLGQSLKQGAIYGGIGAVSGGLIGGVSGGIHAKMLNSERSFWTGSYNQYDLEPELLASNSNILSEQYSIPDDATVTNLDKYKVYYKPEDGVTGIKDYVSPNKYIKAPIDGVATSKTSIQVFKVPDGGKIIVKIGGEVKFSNGMGQYEALETFGFRAGWKYPQYFIDRNAYYKQWDYLFKAANLWIK